MYIYIHVHVHVFLCHNSTQVACKHVHVVQEVVSFHKAWLSIGCCIIEWISGKKAD